MKTIFHPTQKVKLASQHDLDCVFRTFKTPVSLETIFEVVLVVHDCQDYHHDKDGNFAHQSGLVVKLHHVPEPFYPYVWDFQRFIPAE